MRCITTVARKGARRSLSLARPLPPPPLRFLVDVARRGKRGVERLPRKHRFLRVLPRQIVEPIDRHAIELSTPEVCPLHIAAAQQRNRGAEDDECVQCPVGTQSADGVGCKTCEYDSIPDDGVSEISYL